MSNHNLWMPWYVNPSSNGWYAVRVPDRALSGVRLFEDGDWYGFSYKEEVDNNENGKWQLVPMMNFTHWHPLPKMDQSQMADHSITGA